VSFFKVGSIKAHGLGCQRAQLRSRNSRDHVAKVAKFIKPGHLVNQQIEMLAGRPLRVALDTVVGALATRQISREQAVKVALLPVGKAPGNTPEQPRLGFRMNLLGDAVKR
jgi:hypothetical protein